MSAAWTYLASVWKRYGRPDISPGSTGLGLSALGTSPLGG